MRNAGRALLFLVMMCTVLLASTGSNSSANVEGLIDPGAIEPDDNLDGSASDSQVPSQQLEPAQVPPEGSHNPNTPDGHVLPNVLPGSPESQAPSASESAFFPATGDVVSVAWYPYWWNAGDYAEGSRTPGFSSVTGISYDLTIEPNKLIGTGHVDLDLSINGVVVGSFTVLEGETSKSVSFSFPPISGPTFTIRLEETNTVDRGAGSIVIPLDASPLELRTWYRVYLPLAVR
jgi:hypothetical protein